MSCSEEFMTWYLAECKKIGKDVDFDEGFYLYQKEIQKRLGRLE